MLVSQENPRQTVQIFIDLIERHEQSFYYFVHKVHSKGEGLFSGLMRWTERFLDVVRIGIGEPISLEFILPHTGEERGVIMKEIDEVALYHYKLKVQHESKVRRRFGRAGGADVTGEDPVTQDVVNGFMHDVSFGDLMREDMAAEDDESDGSYESSSEYESMTDDSETGSEESSGSPSPGARLRASPSAPPMQVISHHSAQQPFPSSLTSNPTLPHCTEPSVSPRTPSVASPSSSGSRLRKLSQPLRKSRSTTFGSVRPTLSNSADAPPLPPLPLSVVQPQSNVPLTGRSKPLPPQPSSPSSSRASSSRQAIEAPALKRYPTSQILLQTPPPRAKKQITAEGLKPPELKKIPELLPIFVEMVRFFFLPRFLESGDIFTF